MKKEDQEAKDLLNQEQIVHYVQESPFHGPDFQPAENTACGLKASEEVWVTPYVNMIDCEKCISIANKLISETKKP